MKKGVIVLGSSRGDGHTRQVVNYLIEQTGWDLINLSDKNISHFDYDYQNADDDYLPTMQQIIGQYELVLFATPVYWYTMSGIMKVFLDRMTDLLKHHRSLGKSFRGTSIGVISCGADDDVKEGFYMPFIESAVYMHWQYVGHVHTWMKEGEPLISPVKARLDAFLADSLSEFVPAK